MALVYLKSLLIMGLTIYVAMYVWNIIKSRFKYKI